MIPLKARRQIRHIPAANRKALLSAYRTIQKSGLFDRDHYLDENEDVRAAGVDPIVHYLLHGAMEGRNPGPDFDNDWYRSHYPDAAASKLPPLVHYLEIGKAQGLKTKPNEHPGDRLHVAENTRVHLRFYPDYTATNPYQRLLYGEIGGEIDVAPGSLDDCLALQDRSELPVIYHQHWTSVVLGNSPERSGVERRATEYLAKMDGFVARGGRVFWTVHNAISHEAPFPDIEARLCSEIASRAELIHAHSASVPELVSEYYELPFEKVRVGPHGNYIGVYPDEISREEARARLGLPEDARVFLFLGQIRAYKGLEQLLTAFGEIAAKHPKAWLVIAGSAHAMDISGLEPLARQQQRVIFHAEHVPDEELQVFFRSADFYVAPFTTILTSGSVVLSLSFGVPVIAPEIGLVAELIESRKNGLLYAPSHPDELHRQMEVASQLDPSVTESLAFAAKRTALLLDWTESNHLLASHALSRNGLT